MTILETFIKATSDLRDHYSKMTSSEMEMRIKEIKDHLKDKLFLPAHHYQKDEVVQFADVTGDSLQLAKISAENNKADYIVFCGVHFMAETADMLSKQNQTVILPDLKAGCSMADMADIHQTERAWKELTKIFGDTMLPLTYVNSTAAIKAFCGKNGGATVTSSNAKSMVRWAFQQKERLLFLPDQHLGRNTAFDLGINLQDMAVWDPIQNTLIYEGSDLEKVKVILWKGHCSVHEKFTVEQIQEFRKNHSDYQIIVHPECTHEVVRASDYNGSTHYIIETIKNASSGTKWAVGTEMNLVNRLATHYTDKEIVSLNPNLCPCLTMNRIDLAHLLWSLENIMEGIPQNIITVDEETKKYALMALNRMM
ncbi:quinolinate synthase NadA [Fictibacillus phosphorivorans]|uniref:quinolinate synthase NadA n=1 Tax=Fictibacillus phosphorivorans TaxID=1221500 RepID=UPI00203A3EAC|nr:quinolinate synthase NadA [Fictibacillus phosphorivorans]MCM3716994.1 quinolinate synthase NadA [Fictibacillus phosphorivorans]MCM3774457.1 quinolinate synthase NadA [Fictibacillus phosphorivorans]